MPPIELNRERIVMLAVLAAAALACLLGLLDRPAAGLQRGDSEQVLDLLRAASTAALAISLLLGPGLLLMAFPHDHSINVVGGSSPAVIHFFFQYWDGLAFGGAIVFFPLLLVGIWRALRRWPWAVTATVLLPFAIFAAYWGASKSGMLREGLQAWVLTIFIVLACEQAASGFGWLRSTPVRMILVLRVGEVLAMAAVPTLLTRHELLGDAFELSDAVALLAILGFAAALAALVWTMRPPAAKAAAPGRGGLRAR